MEGADGLKKGVCQAGELGLDPRFSESVAKQPPAPAHPPRPELGSPLLLPLGLGVQGVVASLGLELRPPRMAADVGERAVAEVSPENLSETRMTAVTGWCGSPKERLMGRGLGGSGARKVWVASGGPSPGPATCDKRGMVVSARHPLGPQAPASLKLPLPTSSGKTSLTTPASLTSL